QRTLLFALTAAIVSVFVFGLGPAIQTARLDLAPAMKTSDASSKKSSRPRGRVVLVAVQVAISLAVLTIAAFVLQIFQREFSRGPGFRVDHVAVARLDPTQAGYGQQRSQQFFERVLDEAQRLPGVMSAAIASEMPMWGLEVTSMAPEGYQL